MLDDIRYVQHDRDEMEVLFTLLAERYEHLSVALTTNLVFSDWDRIFKDPMLTLTPRTSQCVPARSTPSRIASDGPHATTS